MSQYLKQVGFVFRMKNDKGVHVRIFKNAVPEGEINLIYFDEDIEKINGKDIRSAPLFEGYGFTDTRAKEKDSKD